MAKSKNMPQFKNEDEERDFGPNRILLNILIGKKLNPSPFLN